MELGKKKKKFNNHYQSSYHIEMILNGQEKINIFNLEKYVVFKHEKY